MDLPGDSREYNLLTDAASATTVPGLACEVGCRLGGGVKAIVDGLPLDKPWRTFISIDPYGGIPYDFSDEQRGVRLDYDNQMLARAMCSIPRYCYDRLIRWLPFVMTDQQFFLRFHDGVPLYDGEERIENSYAFVHIDGPHSLGAVMHATDFFVERLAVGGAIAFDDIANYDHAHMERSFLCDLVPEARGKKKAVYRRVR